MRRAATFNIIFIALIILENCALLLFFQKGIFGQQWNSLIYSFSSLLIGITLIAKYYNTNIYKVEEIAVKKVHRVLLPVIALGLLLGLAIKTQNAIIHQPIDLHYSDIIPAIQIMVKKFLHNAFPYSPMHELGYTTPAGYMPMHWLPFSIAQLLHFDYRYISFAALCISVFVILYGNKTNSVVLRYIILILFAWCYYLILQQSQGILTVTAELVIAAYYIFFIAAINKRGFLLQGIAIAFCLLSRYSIVIWLPLWAFVLLVSGQRVQLFKTVATIIILVSAIYILPFVTQNPAMFFTTSKAYANMSWEWQHLCPDGLPCQLYNGVGFAYLFYEHYGPEHYISGFHALQKVFFITTIGSTVLMGLWYWFKKAKIDTHIFLMASFKIYLTIFFAFIIIPYSYLVIVANFVSIAIFAQQAGYDNLSKKL